MPQAPQDFPSTWLEAIPAVLRSPACVGTQVSDLVFPCWPSKWELSWLVAGGGQGEVLRVQGSSVAPLLMPHNITFEGREGSFLVTRGAGGSAMPCCELEIRPGVKN